MLLFTTAKFAKLLPAFNVLYAIQLKFVQLQM